MSLEAVLGDPRLRRCGRALPVEAETIPSGFAEIDALLPGGGWPRGALTEILTDMEGIGALRLVMPALAHLSQSEQWLAWISPPHLPYGPALCRPRRRARTSAPGVGIGSPRERFWALEQSLRAGACSAVLAWPRGLDGRGLRRLQLAAEAGRSLGLLFRPLVARRAGLARRLALNVGACRGRSRQ